MNALLLSALLAAAVDPGFLVVAPDRGFLGNEELRDSYAAFAAGRNAAIVFVTDERTRGSLDGAVMALRKGGARRIVVLPFFLSRSEPRFRRAQALLPAAPEVTWALPFGESYFAVEALAGRLRALSEPSSRRVLVVGAGADAESREAMLADWQRLTDFAAAGVGLESATAVLETSSAALAKSLATGASGAAQTVVVPFQLGSRMDGMMSYTSTVRAAARGLDVVDGEVTEGPTVGLWLRREANRHGPLARSEIGVVALAHGGDHHWNETMLQALAPLGERYMLEPALSMADAVVIGRAVRRLEARGAKAIVVLRAFALEASFRDSVLRLLGQDVEGGDPHAHHAAAGHGDHAGHGPGGPPPARLLSSALFVSVGGMEDHPYFAQALLDRARALSRDPSRETVILAAHGEGDDAKDAHWRELLRSLAVAMRARGGSSFRSIETGTWREDWPDKREPAVREMRAMVEQASRNGGRALVVPARILGRGPERRFLEGLSFEQGEGFAPHPLFLRWAEEQVALAVTALERRGIVVSQSGPGS